MQVYRLLTGPDDNAFCHRVTRELYHGWELHGPPTLAFDTLAGRTICGQAIVKDFADISYSPDLDFTSIGDLPVVIARYTDDDRDGVAGLIVPIQQEEFAIPISLDDQPDLLDIPGFYQVGAGDFWVARQGPAIVGTIGLKEFEPGVGALRKMFVAKSHRGKAGVAGDLLETLLAVARARGFRRIILGTTSAFEAAHRFYEKHGFSQVDESALPTLFPRMAVDTCFYALEL